MKNYYVYRIDDPKTKEFYIGSRLCNCEIENDVYMGSYKSWNPEDKSRLIKIILKSNFRKRETTIKYEARIIKKNINNPLNRNYYIPTTGFHVDGLTWKNSEEIRNKISKIRIDRNLAKGKNNGMYGKSHNMETREKQKLKAKGRYTLKWFIEKYGDNIGNEKYLKKRNLQSINSSGKNNGMYNKKHTIISKQKMSDNSKKRVGKYNTENKLLYIYNSINDAAKDNIISISSISAVCNPNRINKTAAGFIWKLEN